MKKIAAICLISVLCLTLASCRGADLGAAFRSSAPETPTGEPVTTAPPAESSDFSDASEKSDEYVFSSSITVDTDRALTLRLKGRFASKDHPYGINEIQVLDGETLLQTISVEEAIAAEWGEDGGGYNGYTECWNEDGGLSVADLNFDGSEDFGLMGWIPAGANIPSYYWLWNGEAEAFRYAFCLCNLEADGENRRLISHTSGGAILEQTDYYQYDIDGKLQNSRRIVQEVENPGLEQRVTTKVYELVDGVLQITAP